MAELEPPYQPPTEAAPDIFLIPIPIPIPLKYVNCYLCRGATGWTIVDTGFHDALAEDAWTRAFADLGIRPQDVDRILITHYHPDHLGAAGWLQQLTGARAYMHDLELQNIDMIWGSGWAKQAKAMNDFFGEHGMPPEIAQAIEVQQRTHATRVAPLAEMLPITAGEQFRIGGSECEVIWAPGHSEGLAIFWDAENSILHANDMILNKITPNVSLWPNGSLNPLEEYLRSLARVEALGAKLALPGHRTLITDVSGRAAEIRHHHAERLDVMERECGSTSGSTAWEVCQRVFPVVHLNAHQIRFAISETLAHLVYMEKQGRLVRKGNRFVQAD